MTHRDRQDAPDFTPADPPAPTRGPIERCWAFYARATIPTTASEIQLSCMRSAFYAGAAAMLGIMKEGGPEADEEQLELELMANAGEGWLGNRG